MPVNSKKVEGAAAGYGTVQDIGKYLGAKSGQTGRRLVAELRARGLPVYRVGNVPRFKFRDVDRLLAKGMDV